MVDVRYVRQCLAEIHGPERRLCEVHTVNVAYPQTSTLIGTAMRIALKEFGFHMRKYFHIFSDGKMITGH